MPAQRRCGVAHGAINCKTINDSSPLASKLSILIQFVLYSWLLIGGRYLDLLLISTLIENVCENESDPIHFRVFVHGDKM